MAFIYDIPPEILEQIILELDPLYVALLSQTCKAFYSFIYDSPSQHLWRILYLQQPLDDPRTCVDPLGNPISDTEVDWKLRLQRVIRMRTIVRNISLCRPEERETVLTTLRDLACNLPPTPDVPSEQLSLNLVWLAALLRGGAFLDFESWPADLSPGERQLLACIHTHFGLTTRDRRRAKRVDSRAFVYAMRNYTWDNDFGPFLMDGSGTTNWEHIQAIHHDMSMHLVPEEDEEDLEADDSVFTIFPMSLPYCQTVSAPGLNLDDEKDWAGVAGMWTCSFCFCDHRELLLYNNFNISHEDVLQPAVFADPTFVEVFRKIQIEVRVLAVEADENHPTRPKIHFAGEIDSHATMVGCVSVTPDNRIRWHFKSGEQGHAIWSSEGVQIGGVRSTFGVLGAWTTVHHDRHDPIGPFWLRKVPFVGHPSE